MTTPRGLYAGLFYETLFWKASAGHSGALPLVVLPGMLSDGQQVRRLLRELGRSALVVDPLGSGRSESPDHAAEYLLPTLAERLVALLEALEIEEADLLGLSMGGMWAQHALLLHPQKFRSGMFVCSSAKIGPRIRSILLGVRALWTHGVPPLEVWRILQVMLFSPGFLERPSAVPLLEFLGSDMRTSPTAALHQLDALLAHDLAAKLPAIGAAHRTSVIGGQLDVLMPPQVQDELSALLGGGLPKILEGGGHALWLEQPTALAAEISQCLVENGQTSN